MRKVEGQGLGWALGGYLVGTLWQLQQAALWPHALSLCLTVAAGAGLAAWAWTRGRAETAGGLSAMVWALLAGLLAASVADLRAHGRLGDRLAPALEGQDLEVVGVIAGLPQWQEGRARFRFDVESARPAFAGEDVRPQPPAILGVPSTVMLGWGGGFEDGALQRRPPEDLQAGQRWRFVVRLRQPHGSFNPQGFDVELWLFENGLGATGSVRLLRSRQPEWLGIASGYPVQRARQAVADAIRARVPDARGAGVLAALVVGEQSAIARADWDLFRITGVSHLMAISGLHVTMFAWLAAGVLRRLWRHRQGWMLALPAPVAARWGGLMLALGYSVFSGWGVPSQRTVWMLATVAVLAQTGRRWPWGLMLLCTATVVAAVDPWALLAPGFWLSFVAVALLMASGDGAWVQATVSTDPGRWSRWKGWLRQSVGAGLRTQAIATVGLAPLTLIFFQQVSVVGFVANLVAIPVVTLGVTPLAMLGMVAAPCWDLAALTVGGLSAWLEWLARWRWAEWLTAAPPGWAMGAGVAGAVLAVLPGPRGPRALALLLLVPLLWPPVPRPASGTFEIVALDVGQGTSVLVRTARHTLIYDTGPIYSADNDAGQRVLLPVLQALGERRIDLLMLSHRDADHVGGARAVLARHPDVPVSSSLEDGHELLRLVKNHQPCRAGQGWQWDGVAFELLHPGADDQAPPLKPNQVSCVLRVSGAGHSALLTGDIEHGEEARLVAQWGEALATDLLIVPHHGSKTSSTVGFLDAVQPRVAVFQAAYRSRFGHPAPEVWERYGVRGIERIATPTCGAYRWSQGQGRCERDLRPRYWHHGRQGA